MPGSNQEEARQKAGGPPLPHSGVDVGAQITALDTLTTTDLQIEWRRLYLAAPPNRLSRDLLLRGIAYELQEQVHGGLSPDIQRRLRSLVESTDKQSRSRATLAITLKPGTKLVREWRGHVHAVNILDDGLDYRDQRYRSLTRVARLIIGVHWSAPLFIGLNKRRPAMEGHDE